MHFLGDLGYEPYYYLGSILGPLLFGNSNVLVPSPNIASGSGLNIPGGTQSKPAFVGLFVRLQALCRALRAMADVEPSLAILIACLMLSQGQQELAACSECF